MQQEYPRPSNEVILISDQQDDPMDQTDDHLPPLQQQTFQLPYNKSQLFFVMSSQLIREKFDALLKLPENENRQVSIAKYEFQASDGQKWRVDVGIQFFNPQQVQFQLEYESIGLIDQSKGYKFNATLMCAGIKKHKEIKKDPKQKKSLCFINISIEKLLVSTVCIELDVTVETAFRYNSKDEVGFTGLLNVSSLCYMNSVFQILFGLTHFRRLIFQIKDITDQSEFPATLQSLFYCMMTQRNSVSTQEIIKSFKWDQEQQAIQHDVQEFMMELLKGIEKRLVDQKKISQEIMSLFQGQLENNLEGIDVKYSKRNYEDFMDIQLQVEDCKDINAAFQLFAAKELLSGENKIETDNYGKQACYKYQAFTKLPPVLFINLKRYRYSIEEGELKKINDRFVYYDHLDMSPYMSKDALKSNDLEYRLFGVMVHRGELIHHGHYYCFLRHNKQWLKFDDRIVTRATEQQVFDNNFGGKYEGGEYNPALRQVIVNQLPQPETAYMLVYVRQYSWEKIFKPLVQNDVPEWISQREATQNKKLELKNYLMVHIITHQSLLDMPYDRESLRNGFLYHKRATNSNIDIEKLEQSLKLNSIELYIPKNWNYSQLYHFLSHQFNVEAIDLKIFLYKITQAKENTETITFLQRNTKKTLLSLLNLKYAHRSFFITTSDVGLNRHLFQQFQLVRTGSYQLIASDDMLPQTLVEDDEQEFALLLVKSYFPQKIMEIEESLAVPISKTIEQIKKISQKFVNPKAKESQVDFYIYENFSVIQYGDQFIDTIVKQNKNYLITILAEIKHKSMSIQYSQDEMNGDGNANLMTALQWANYMQDRREVVFKEGQLQAPPLATTFHKDQGYWDLVQHVSEIECHPKDHIILKIREKKGLFAVLKAPDENADQSQKQKLRGKPGQQLSRLDEIIQNDNIVIFKYSAVSINDMKTQFAINYSICPWFSQTQDFNDIIFLKDRTIDDLYDYAQQQGHFEAIKQEIKILQIEENIVPLLIKKKNQQILFGRNSHLSLAKIKQAYNIQFCQVLQIGSPNIMTARLHTAEGTNLIPPICLESQPDLTFQTLFLELVKILQKRQINYSGESYVFSNNDIQIKNQEGRLKNVPYDLQIFLATNREEKFLKNEERIIPINQIVKEESDLDNIQWTIIFNSICDQRTQRMRQQGICLNL